MRAAPPHPHASPMSALRSVVLDTNVVVAAGFRPRSASGRVLAALRAGRLRLVWDDATRAETERIVGRIPPLAGRDAMPPWTAADRWTGATDPAAFAHVPDPDDRRFAALAAAAGATLVTMDAHLLVGRAAGPPRIVTPGELARELDALVAAGPP